MCLPFEIRKKVEELTKTNVQLSACFLAAELYQLSDLYYYPFIKYCRWLLNEEHERYNYDETICLICDDKFK